MQGYSNNFRRRHRGFHWSFSGVARIGKRGSIRARFFSTLLGDTCIINPMDYRQTGQ